MAKIRVKAVPRKKIDTAGLLSVLIELALEEARSASKPGDPAPKQHLQGGAAK
jgi:hypothetical protein